MPTDEPLGLRLGHSGVVLHAAACCLLHWVNTYWPGAGRNVELFSSDAELLVLTVKSRSNQNTPATQHQPSRQEGDKVKRPAHSQCFSSTPKGLLASSAMCSSVFHCCCCVLILSLAWISSSAMIPERLRLDPLAPFHLVKCLLSRQETFLFFFRVFVCVFCLSGVCFCVCVLLLLCVCMVGLFGVCVFVFVWLECRFSLELCGQVLLN